MSDTTIAAPKKSPFTLRWIAFLVCSLLVGYFVAHYEEFLPHRWQTYTTPDGLFSLQLPAEPTVRPTQVPVEGEGTVTVNMVTAAPTNRATYLFASVEREGLGQKSTDQVLSAALNGGLRKIQGNVLTQKNITVQGYPGLDAQATARGNSLADFRIILVDKRLVMIMALATAEQDRESKTIQRVFDSFKINQK